ncbi:phospholipase A1 1 [Nilaparvata lugens]|uniref:phospholipase A1 1 n=1 Tax=Nilaparvata lugens TaxID=108931 RepID=UPI00193EA26F|nr:phospholipase A1 1 [Nilaparvata lugens]
MAARIAHSGKVCFFIHLLGICCLLTGQIVKCQNHNEIDAPAQKAVPALPQTQDDNELNSVTGVRDLFNTSSCVDPPLKCPHYRIQFYLYTRYKTNYHYFINQLHYFYEIRRISSRDFDLHKEKLRVSYCINSTRVIIHGFQGGRNFSPSTDLRDAYFERGDYNIIIVDYSTLVRIPCLNQIEWSPRFCAQCIAQMIEYLNEHPRGVPPDKLHLMGYSIGAHIAGLTANFVVNGKLGRITGLDPTIIFYMGNNATRDLDPNDAHFVDVIHTGAGVLGQWGPNGHADFYVNGGTSQPGCLSTSIIRTLSCDHTKVTPYFIESINSKKGFWAVSCANRVLYNLGLCTGPDAKYYLMGEDASPKLRGIFYLSTNANKPYAQGHPRSRPRRNRRPSNATTSSSSNTVSSSSNQLNRLQQFRTTAHRNNNNLSNRNQNSNTRNQSSNNRNQSSNKRNTNNNRPQRNSNRNRTRNNKRPNQ